MDRQETQSRFRIHWQLAAFIGVFVTLWASPVAAQTPTITPTVTATPTLPPTPTPEATPTREVTQRELYIPPNEGIHINSPEVRMSARLPMALPDLPAVPSLPEVDWPVVDHSGWPSVADEREEMYTTANERLDSIHDTLAASYNTVNTVLDNIDSSIASTRAFIGDPLATTAGSSDSSFTVSAMAQKMSQGVATALGYMRAVARMGPVGVDLVFVFVGLGWMLFISIGEWLLMLITTILKLIAGVIRWIIDHIIAFVKFVVDIFI